RRPLGDEAQQTPSLELDPPFDAHLPHDYIAHERLRLEAYAKLSHVTAVAELEEIRAELVDRYGPVPEPVERLFAVARVRVKARTAGLTDITGQGKYIRFAPVELPESAQVRLKRIYPGTVLKPAVRTILVPAPMTARLGGKPLRDEALLDWVGELIDAVLARETSVTAAAEA